MSLYSRQEKMAPLGESNESTLLICSEIFELIAEGSTYHSMFDTKNIEITTYQKSDGDDM